MNPHKNGEVPYSIHNYIYIYYTQHIYIYINMKSSIVYQSFFNGERQTSALFASVKVLQLMAEDGVLAAVLKALPTKPVLLFPETCNFYCKACNQTPESFFFCQPNHLKTCHFDL